MIKPDSYEESLTAAELACAEMLAQVLGLQLGKTLTVGLGKGLPEAAVFDAGYLMTGSTVNFAADVHHFRAKLVLYNGNREKIQRWVMRLVERFPVSEIRNPTAPIREDTNVRHFRIAPERDGLGQLETTDVQAKSGGVVSTWTVTIPFDLVFWAKPDEAATSL